MREVIRINQPSTEQEKPVEFTHVFASKGKKVSEMDPSEFDYIVYIGKCSVDGDLFAAYLDNGTIRLYAGHLNSGKY